MKFFKRTIRKWLLMVTAALGSLWMFFLLIDLDEEGNLPAYIFRYSWLEYTYDDSGPEKMCNCTAIMQGEKNALEKAKLLTITKKFKKSVHVPDEYYINATQDCRCVASYHYFQCL